MWPWDPIVDTVLAPFQAAAGWAWDTVIGGITDWLAKGFVQLVSFVWSVMDQSTSPRLNSEWFSNSTGAPYLTAVMIADRAAHDLRLLCTHPRRARRTCR